MVSEHPNTGDATLPFKVFYYPLTSFGSVAPIPDDIRVLGVEHPYELNCSRSVGYKLKLTL